MGDQSERDCVSEITAIIQNKGAHLLGTGRDGAKCLRAQTTPALCQAFFTFPRLEVQIHVRGSVFILSECLCDALACMFIFAYTVFMMGTLAAH